MAYMLVRRHNSAYWCHPKRRRNATASVHHGQAELHEPCTHADAQAAPRTVTQNSLPVQRYCIRATSSCNAPARVASLGDEVLNGSTEAQETGTRCINTQLGHQLIAGSVQLMEQPWMAQAHL